MSTLCSTLIGVSIVFVCFNIGRFINERTGECIGLIIGCIIGFSCAYIFGVWQDDIYKSIPYHDTPDTVYELDADLDIPVYQTGEKNTIMFFTTDGKSHTENYAEMERCKDGKNCIEVYKRDDISLWWLGMRPLQKIVIYTD